jgi:signal transduction histidine kinase
LILLFSILVVISIGFTSFLIVHYIETMAIEHDIAEMESKVAEKEEIINSLHQRASQDIVFALKNPLFRVYFELPETKAGNQYVDGVLQFTERQRRIKAELEDWIFTFQAKFTIDETCLIDSTGQEHSRLVSRKIEPDERLSSDEHEMPFFKPSFKKGPGEVHVESPYLSPDTHRWVFAYTSPVVLKNGKKPAFFHFEVPVKWFQDVSKVNYGRMYVINANGYLMADTGSVYPDKPSTRQFGDFFPSVDTGSVSEEFTKFLASMRAAGSGVGSYETGGAIHHVVFRKLTAFDWLLAFEVTEAMMLSSGGYSVNRLKFVVALIASLAIFGTLISVFVISKRITDPIIRLGNATRRIRMGSLDTTIVVKGDDEIHDLAESFNAMAGSLKKTIELEKRLAMSEQELKHERLAAIGSVSARIVHDMRNALSTIKTTVAMLQRNAKGLDSVTKERYGRLERGVDLITFQVNSVLNFIRSKPLGLGRHSLLEIARSALDDVVIPEGITISLPETDVEVWCDGNKIESVFENLLVNAAQAIGETGQIHIRVREDADKVVFEVEDSGPGIPEELLPGVFDLVFTTKEQGTGLGLFSCKTSVEQHGGTISAYNDPTRFVIELPKADASSSEEKQPGAEEVLK